MSSSAVSTTTTAATTGTASLKAQTVGDLAKLLLAERASMAAVASLKSESETAVSSTMESKHPAAGASAGPAPKQEVASGLEHKHVAQASAVALPPAVIDQKPVVTVQSLFELQKHWLQFEHQLELLHDRRIDSETELKVFFEVITALGKKKNVLKSSPEDIRCMVSDRVLVTDLFREVFSMPEALSVDHNDTIRQMEDERRDLYRQLFGSVDQAVFSRYFSDVAHSLFSTKLFKELNQILSTAKPKDGHVQTVQHLPEVVKTMLFRSPDTQKDNLSQEVQTYYILMREIARANLKDVSDEQTRRCIDQLRSYRYLLRPQPGLYNSFYQSMYSKELTVHDSLFSMAGRLAELHRVLSKHLAGLEKGANSMERIHLILTRMAHECDMMIAIVNHAVNASERARQNTKVTQPLTDQELASVLDSARGESAAPFVGAMNQFYLMYQTKQADHDMYLEMRADAAWEYTLEMDVQKEIKRYLSNASSSKQTWSSVFRVLERRPDHPIAVALAREIKALLETLPKPSQTPQWPQSDVSSQYSYDKEKYEGDGNKVDWPYFASRISKDPRHPLKPILSGPWSTFLTKLDHVPSRETLSRDFLLRMQNTDTSQADRADLQRWVEQLSKDDSKTSYWKSITDRVLRSSQTDIVTRVIGRQVFLYLARLPPIMNAEELVGRFGARSDILTNGNHLILYNYLKDKLATGTANDPKQPATTNLSPNAELIHFLLVNPDHPISMDSEIERKVNQAFDGLDKLSEFDYGTVESKLKAWSTARLTKLETLLAGLKERVLKIRRDLNDAHEKVLASIPSGNKGLSDALQRYSLLRGKLDGRYAQVIHTVDQFIPFGPNQTHPPVTRR